ncbi:hypothetical protein DCC81_25210 [Chitinophaga parva]|uniref:YknX-like C-terminal permuted SH3-like domain-containing protein n=1 Tax=Chitinophaga parva TaxID=2169414 RepID=A0A2T7BBE5_9BACT|nr:efflux RND transporter periplasmic adaptor subunit [Chitinophaga parva]PUZ21309.1 hypothetical protein DCC81_25210 [Chitinophaga parva]
MSVRLITILLPLFLTIILLGCKENDRSSENDGVVNQNADRDFLTTHVKVYKTNVGPFRRQIVTNGKIESLEALDIKFPYNDRIVSIPVKNGEYVSRGQVIAELDKTELLRKLNKANRVLERATILLADKLIDYGYKLSDSATIPKEIMKMAKIRSDYSTASMDLEEVLYALQQSTITAPNNGIIANLEARVGEYSESFSLFCKIIDNQQMIVKFSVLESDIDVVKLGSNIDVTSYGGSGDRSNGIVNSINPLIDKDGMISVAASVPSSRKTLMSGMNVKITVFGTVSQSITIPKEAIVDKQGKKIVFLSSGGKARWTEIETGPENEKYVVVYTGLTAGQSVIVSNPELLTNGTNITVD